MAVRILRCIDTSYVLSTESDHSSTLPQLANSNGLDLLEKSVHDEVVMVGMCSNS